MTLVVLVVGGLIAIGARDCEDRAHYFQSVIEPGVCKVDHDCGIHEFIAGDPVIHIIYELF